MAHIKMAFTGDTFIAQALPESDNSLQNIKSYLSSHDIRFTNLEVVLHNFEQSPSPSSGGTWAVARPERLDDITSLSFNLLACANNHNLDWLHGGVISTIEALRSRKISYTGIGRTLSEAAQVAYLPTPNGCVAMISVCSSFQKWHRAGDARGDVLGRPGLHPLGFTKIHYVTPEQMAVLKQINSQTTINAARNLDLKEGFITDESTDFALGNDLRFRMGEPCTKEEINVNDLSRVKRLISEAKRQADFVIVSFHSHEFNYPNKDEPADFIREFCHQCIDDGADILVGHGPHILRGIELYKQKPIFYSLGNFIFQNDLVERQPKDFFELYQLDENSSIADAMDVRSNYGKRGLSIDRRVWESVIASVIWSDDDIIIELQPIDLGFGKSRATRGRPALCYGDKAQQILTLLQEKSAPFGTHINIVGDKGFIKLAINDK